MNDFSWISISSFFIISLFFLYLGLFFLNISLSFKSSNRFSFLSFYLFI